MWPSLRGFLATRRIWKGVNMARVFKGLGAWLVSPAAHRVAFALLVVLWPASGNSLLIGCS